MSKIKWDQEAVQTLTAAAGVEGSIVTQEQISVIAEQFGNVGFAKSIAAKLRHMKYNVEKVADKGPVFSEAETQKLVDFVSGNAGVFTAAEIADKFQNGKFTVAQVRGKVLSLELNSSVKAAPKVEVARTYSEAEEARITSMWNAGAFAEDIAEALGKSLNSVRGKCLSMLKTFPEGTTLPAQKNKVAKTDFLDGVDVANLTVEEIAEQTERTVTGIKSTLTRRGISASNYDGEAKAAKRVAKLAKG